MNETAVKEMKFGYSVGVPEDSTEAWGARLIVNSRGMVDMLRDRQGWFGDQATLDKLCACVNAVRDQWTGNLSKMLTTGEVRLSEPLEVVVYEDDVLKMVGNTNGSYEYFYLAAWLKK